MTDCIYKTCDGYCTKHSDGIVREPCVEGPCNDEWSPEPPKEDTQGI